MLYLAASGEVQVWSPERDNPSQVRLAGCLFSGSEPGRSGGCTLRPAFRRPAGKTPRQRSPGPACWKEPTCCPATVRWAIQRAPGAGHVKIIVGTRPPWGAFICCGASWRGEGWRAIDPVSYRFACWRMLRGRKVRRSASSLPRCRRYRHRRRRPRSGAGSWRERGAEEGRAIAAPDRSVSALVGVGARGWRPLTSGKQFAEMARLVGTI